MATNSIDKLFSFLEEQNPILFKEGDGGSGFGTVATSTESGIFTPTYGGNGKKQKINKLQPPRPGLAPKTGNFEHPFRWIKPVETDEEITPEIFHELMNFLPAAAKSPEGATRVFYSKLNNLAKKNNGIIMYHESPGNVAYSIKRFGIQGDSVFAALGEPSNFVSGLKTIVKFKVPEKYMKYIQPDMQFGWSEKITPEQMLLLQYPDDNMMGAYISFNGNIPSNWIEKIEVVENKKTKILNKFNKFIEKSQVAHHMHDGFQEHPVAVKNHQAYFSGSVKQLPYGEQLDPSILRRFYAAYKLRQAGNLDVAQKEFVENMIGGVSDDELKEFFNQQYGRQRQETSRKTSSMKIPNTIEEIDDVLKALGRARVRPWGSKDVAAQNNISDRVRELSEAKKSLEENNKIQKFQDFINITKSDLSNPWFGKTYADVFQEYPVTEIDINKASKRNIIATPKNKEGKFDADAVPSGASVWITINLTSSPLHGRHVLITKLPDGRFALTGGMGMSEATEARRHLILGGAPKKTKRDAQLETEADEAEALNEPLRVAKKEAEKEARAEIKKASDSMLEALGIKKLDKDNLLEKKEEIQKFIESELGEEGKEQAKRITDTVMRHFIAAEREIKERVQAQRQVAITRVGKRLASLKDVSEIIDELPEDTEALTINIPEVSDLSELTPGEQELAISKHFGDQVDNFFAEDPVPASTTEIPEKKEKLPVMELGTTIEPLKLESVEQLQATINTVKNYWDKRSEAEQIKSQIRKVTKISAIPSTIADLQKTISDSGVTMSLEEIEQKVASDQHQWMRNERTQSFYDAVGDFWNDDKSLEESLNSGRSDTSMYHNVSSGAATALAALSQQYGGAKLDTKKLLEASNIEVGAAALALNLRIQYQKDAVGYDRIIQEVQTFNANNQTETERKALEKHGQLKTQFAEIQRQKEGAELLDKIRITSLESDLILEQRKNLGAALGSLQASAAFLDNLSKFRSATNDVISINVGKDVDDAYDVVNRLRLKKGYTVDTSDPDNIKINVGLSRVDKLVTEEKAFQSKADKYEKIKTDMSGVSEDEEGRLTVDNFDVPGFKKEWTDEAGKTHPYKWRVEQRNDINWLREASKKTADNPEGIGGGLITRVTGAGKTNTAYGFFGFQMKQNPDYKALAIVPKGRVQQWVDEAKKFTDLNIEMVPEGLARDKVEDLLAKSKKGTIYVVAHREAAKASDMLHAIQNDKDLQFSGFVVDEPQELQARGQSGNIGEMGRRIFNVPVKHRIALTATPARRNPVEAYDLIKWSSGSKEIGTKAFFKRVFSGFGSGTNAQDTAISDMFFKTVQPYISGDRLTTPNFKVKQENISITRSPEQIGRQKEIESQSAGYIAKRREEISNEIKNNPAHPFRRSHTWETRLSRYANDTARKEVAQMHRENFDNRSATTGAKMVALKNELKKNLTKKQVIYIDSSTQRHSLQAVFDELGLKQNQIKNIAAGVTSMTGEEMSARAHAFQKDPNVKIILIDAKSSVGFNLQQGSALHIIGTPPEASTLLQANGRVARMPRTGDVEVKTYRYSDNPTEASLWNDIDNQLKVLRAASPGLFLGT